MSDKKYRICVITTQHHADDVRIYKKEIISLKRIASEIHFIVRKRDNFQPDADVYYHWLNNKKNILGRIIRNIQALVYAFKLHVDVYHFHDPELIFTGFLLKTLKRKKVIYDMHELYTDAIIHRTYLPKLVRRFFLFVYMAFERFFLPYLDALILAEESYIPDYQWHKNWTTVQNYLIKENLVKRPENNLFGSPFQFVYLGGVTVQRGIWEMLHFIKLLNENNLNVHFHLIGGFSTTSLKKQVVNWINEHHMSSIVTIYDFVPHEKALKILRQGQIGLLFLHPIRNNVNIMPTKLFEYMGNGLVVFATNFPRWVALNREHQFGLTIDIFNLQKNLPDVLTFLNDNKKMYRIAKKNIDYVMQHYLWENEVHNLYNLYERLFEK